MLRTSEVVPYGGHAPNNNNPKPEKNGSRKFISFMLSEWKNLPNSTVKSFLNPTKRPQIGLSPAKLCATTDPGKRKALEGTQMYLGLYMYTTDLMISAIKP